MPMLQFKNNATTTLAGSINDSQTSITVSNSGLFPVLSGGDYFYATMYEVSGSTEINIEIVKVTAVVGTTWTVTRGQDGTTARSRAGITTVYIELRWTAASAMMMLQKDNNLSDLQNAATARTNLGLGTMATQAASNVNITGGTISGVTVTSVDSTTTIIDNADATKKLAFELSGITTGTTRTLTIPNASGTIALTSDLSAGYQPLDSDLTALAALAANGIIARTGTGTVAVRSITQPGAGITVTNGDGVSGNPTLALADDLAAIEALSSTGFVRRTALNTWSAAAIADGDLPSSLTGKTYNALTLTSNATGFSLAGGTTSKTFTVQNSITLAGTDGTTITLPSVTGTVALNNQSFFIGTTSVAINRASASLSLTGVSIDGSAGSASTATSATTATNIASGVLGSVPYQSASGTTTLLAPNTTATRNFLRMTGTGTVGAAPVWDTVTKADVGLSSVENTALSTWTGASTISTVGTISIGTWQGTAVGIAYGGTGATTKTAAFNALTPMTTVGDIEYHDGTNGTRLAGNTTTTKKFLRSTGNGTAATAPAWDTLVDGDLPSALTGKTYNALSLTAAATGFTIAGGTTSKTLTVSNTLTLAGTDAATLNIGAGGTLGSAAFTASTAYAPAAGSSSITTLGTITSGTWTGSAIGVSYGGTGATSKTAAFDALSPATTLGDLIYYDGADNVRLAGNTTTAKRFLTQTGTGSVSAAPGWNSIVDGDLPSALTGKTYNGLTLTANATGFSVSGGTTAKTLAVSNNLTLAGTDGSTLNIGGGGTLGSAAYTNSSDYLTAASAASTYAALTGATFTGNTFVNSLRLNGGNTSDTIYQATGDLSVSVATASNLKLNTNNATRLLIDGNGFISIGGSASGWASGTKAVDFQYYGSIFNVASGNFYFGQNTYTDGANWRAKATGSASMYAQSLGAHYWYSAASVAGGATQAMSQTLSLDASGNLGVSGSITAVGGGISANGANATITWQDRNTTTNYWSLHSTSNVARLWSGVAGSAGDKLTIDASGNLAIAGTFSGGSLTDASVTPEKLSQKLTRGTAVSSTSGAYVEFTGIPSWAKRITLVLSGVSNNGSSNPSIQIGPSSGVETSSYSQSSAPSNGYSYSSNSSGFAISRASSSAGEAVSGSIVLNNISGSTWVANGAFCVSGTGTGGIFIISTGSKTITGSLERIRLNAGGSDSFDAGIVNIMYE